MFLQDRRIRYRIAINLGDIVIAGHGILADERQCCVSACRPDRKQAVSAYQAPSMTSLPVRWMLPLRMHDEQTVKNVPRPVQGNWLLSGMMGLCDRSTDVGASLPLPKKPSESAGLVIRQHARRF